VEISVRVLSDAGGLRLGVFRDISDRKAAEQMIRESEARLRAIVDAAPFGMHFYRLEGDQLIYAAQSARYSFLAWCRAVLGTASRDRSRASWARAPSTGDCRGRRQLAVR
jgi:PAS domain-containing protein